MAPKVSVIIPIFNVESYLQECLQSVLGQTLKEIEIVCVNDGSTDSSPEIIKRFMSEDSRIRLIDKANAGYGAAMNDGIAAAKGEYISIVESDDYILPDMLERYYRVARDYDLEFVKSDFKIFWGDGDDRKYQLRKLTDKTAYYDVKVNPSEDFGLFRLNNLTQPGIYKLAFLRANDICYHESPGASYQDNGFWFQIFAQAKSAMFLRDAYYMLRRDNPNSSVKNKGKAYCICAEYDFIRDKLIERGLESFLGICAQARFANYEWTCQRVDDRLLLGFFDRYASDFRKLAASGELDKRFFTPAEWARLNEIMRAGSSYYITGWLPRVEIRRLKGESISKERSIKKIKQSNSYKIGRLITKPIRRLKKASNSMRQTMGKAQADEGILNRPCSERVYSFNKDIAACDLAEHVKRVYAEMTKGELDLDHPVSYNEKVQYRKVHDPLRAVKTYLTDKFAVRGWVGERIGERYLVPCFGVWDRFEDIDFSVLPNQFVLKATHGCAMTMIVHDKNRMDMEHAAKQFEIWLSTNFAYCNGMEMQYKDIPPRIIAEHYLENSKGDLYDYKFWCFDGEVKYIQFLSNRSQELLMSFYDKDWVLQPFRYDHPNHPCAIERPADLEEMISVAERLSQGFDHVRVDLYDTPNEGVKFGEMTFSSASGYCAWSPPEADFMLGDLWSLQ